MRLADHAHSVKITVWKNHESNFYVANNTWMNEAIVASSLKVTGKDDSGHTEVVTTNGSRIWTPTDELTETLKARALASEHVQSLSKPFEGGAPDYNTIDGEPIHLSTLASMVMPNVTSSVIKTPSEASSCLSV